MFHTIIVNKTNVYGAAFTWPGETGQSGQSIVFTRGEKQVGLPTGPRSLLSKVIIGFVYEQYAAFEIIPSCIWKI